ncbi:MAG: DMT family transporter [Roseovarius sp.]|nr:DMT family transporter [Roseovarius sp.]
MRLFLLTALTMIAFAANSVLNRMALAGGTIDATSFGTIRLVAGAGMLGLLCLGLRGGLRLGGAGRVAGVGALLLYIYGFSGAYTALDAGLGALILFGVVQITMFAGSLIAREAIPPRRALGAALAFAGLVWLLWPGAGPQVSVLHGLMMAAAGLGWGIYSLAGRKSTDALQGTAANFLLAAPLGLLLGLLIPASGGVRLGAEGIALAVLSGAVTSGLGYALWYRVLPDLPASSAAVAQLSVPVIAMAGGVLLLGETLGLPLIIAGAVVLGGVALSVVPVRGRR